IAAAPARTPHLPAGAPGTGPTVDFARSGLSLPWSDDYPSLLELAEACDVSVRWSCRTGVCHSCETTLIEGGVDYSPDPVEPPAARARRARPLNPHATDFADAVEPRALLRAGPGTHPQPAPRGQGLRAVLRRPDVRRDGGAGRLLRRRAGAPPPDPRPRQGPA